MINDYSKMTPYVYIGSILDPSHEHFREGDLENGEYVLSGSVTSAYGQLGVQICKLNRTDVNNTDITYLSGDIGCVCTKIKDYAFSECADLYYVSIPSITYVGECAFNNCKSLSTVDLPAAKYIAPNAFNGCSNLSNFVSETIQSIADYSFYNTNIVEVEFPDVSSVGDYSFAQCQNLKSIYLPKTTTYGKHAFDGCYLETANVIKGLSVSEGMYYCCPKLKYVNLVQQQYICKQAFSYCNNLDTVNANYVRYINDEAFSYCRNLSSIQLKNVRTIGQNSFSNCINLLSGFFRSCVSIGENAFFNCFNLKYIDLSKYKYTDLIKKTSIICLPSGCRVKCSDREFVVT